MQKIIAAIVVLCAGCSLSPSRPPDLRAWIAVTGAYSLMSPSPAPLPPAPAPGATCENCRGTGRVGDSTVSSVCPICKGSGVTPSGKPLEAPLPPALPSGASAPPRASSAVPAPARAAMDDAPMFRIVCEDGICRRIRIQPNSTAR